MPAARVCRLIALGLLIASTTGCFGTSVNWLAPEYVAPSLSAANPKSCKFDHAEHLYALALCKERCCQPGCVDLFFEAAVLTSRHSADCEKSRKRRLHDSCLAKLVSSGQEFGKLDPSGSLSVRLADQEILVPITHHGFVWAAQDFQTLTPVGDYTTNAMTRLHRCPGVGLPLVVTREQGDKCEDQSFLSETANFAATIRLIVKRPADWDSNDGEAQVECQLAMYDPLRIDETEVDDQPRAIKKDISAPIAYAFRDVTRTYLSNFINPNASSSEPNLRVLEPYQRGKIPVLFVHGLLSDPFTWAEAVNELRARPGFVDRYQLWVFEYPTGDAFLRSAAALRAQMQQARATFDPNQSDRQLCNAVIVGHSMGGLVAKLQITSSGDRLWNSIANRPVDQVRMPSRIRKDVLHAFYFKASPCVSRVVFMATPHRGSNFSNLLVGKLGALLVRRPRDRQRDHQALIDGNPGVFSNEVRRRIPTSIDILDPESDFLTAVRKLPVCNRVRMHSVIGKYRYAPTCKPSDGIVPVDSAREHRAITEKFVNACHTQVNKHPAAIRELICILEQHWQESEPTFVEQAVMVANAVAPVTTANGHAPAFARVDRGRTTSPSLLAGLGIDSKHIGTFEQQPFRHAHRFPLGQNGTGKLWFIGNQSVDATPDHCRHRDRVVHRPYHHVLVDSMGPVDEGAIDEGRVDG